MEREGEIVNCEDMGGSEPFVGRSPRESTPEEEEAAAAALTKSRDAAAKVSVNWGGLFDSSGLASVILAALIAMVVMKMASPTVVKPKVWTLDELGNYNGTDKSLPLLLSILGSVFDVSQGRNHYGPDGGYHHFTGRDASRSFVSGNFTGDGLSDSLQGLTALQVKSIDDWKNFFGKKYIYMGTLVGPYYDEHGKPTKELTRVARHVALATKITLEQKEDEKRFPSCNSRWSPKQGGEVWCTTGYPRIVDRVSEGTYKGTTGTRCACFEGKFLRKLGLKVYEGCSPAAKKCQSSPPEVEEI